MADEAAKQGGGDDARRRDAPILAFFVGVALVAVATVLARLFAFAVVHDARAMPDEFGSAPKRLAKFVHVLPQIARQKGPTAIVLGSSLGYYGVALDTFDGRMRELGVPMTTYTAATPMVRPAVDLALARRIGDAFGTQNRRVSLLLVELAPQVLTRTSISVPEVRRATLKTLSAVADAESIFDLGLRRPDEAAHVAALALLGNENPNAIDAVLRRRVFGGGSERDAPGPRVQLQRTLEWMFGEGASGWNVKTRGEPRWLFPETQLAYLQMTQTSQASKKRQHGALARRMVEVADAIEFHIDDESLAEFIKLVKKAQSISQHTIVWIPVRNPEFPMPSRTGRERLAKALDQIRTETHASIVDLLEAPDIGPEDFMDATHLVEHSGRQKFSRQLAEAVARAIKSEEATEPPPQP